MFNEENIPRKDLLKMTEVFCTALQREFSDHNTILTWQVAADRMYKALKSKSVEKVYKVHDKEMRKFVKYLIDQGKPIGFMTAGCYWAFSSGELHFALSEWQSKKKYADEIFSMMDNLSEKLTMAGK